MTGPWIYTVEWRRHRDNGVEETLARYAMPESLVAEIALREATTEGILNALRDRLREEIRENG